MDVSMRFGWRLRLLALATLVVVPGAVPAQTPASPAAQSPATPSPSLPASPPAAPSTMPSVGASPNAAAPSTPKPATPLGAAAPPVRAAPNAASPAAPAPLAPGGKPQIREVEPNGSPQTPSSTTTESIEVPARPIVFASGQSSYDDAFASIKASLAKVRAAMAKAGLTATGHPLTIFTQTDDKGFHYEAAVPIAAKPAGTSDLGDGVAIGLSPSGSGLKFRHHGPFDDIDSTYDLIVAYLDEKGLQVESPYIEEYLGDLTTADDPNLEVDIYTFVKK